MVVVPDCASRADDGRAMLEDDEAAGFGGAPVVTEVRNRDVLTWPSCAISACIRTILSRRRTLVLPGLSARVPVNAAMAGAAEMAAAESGGWPAGVEAKSGWMPTEAEEGALGTGLHAAGISAGRVAGVRRKQVLTCITGRVRDSPWWCVRTAVHRMRTGCAGSSHQSRRPGWVVRRTTTDVRKGGGTYRVEPAALTFLARAPTQSLSTRSLAGRSKLLWLYTVSQPGVIARAAHFLGECGSLTACEERTRIETEGTHKTGDAIHEDHPSGARRKLTGATLGVNALTAAGCGKRHGD